jgi:nucleotide-binding universal stress UspA family protein
MFVPKRILVPTDFSSYSDEALRKAVDLGKQCKAKVFILHVARVAQHWPTGYALNLEIPTIEDYEAASIKLAEELIDEQVKRLKLDAEEVDLVYDVKTGEPYEEILSQCTRKGMDLIVIASHGRTGVMSHLIGSVALKVAQHAKCPVLLVRPS